MNKHMLRKISFDRITVYGHRGWASSGIVQGLASSGAPVWVLHRPGFDTSSLPANVETVEVDLTDQKSLVHNLKKIDIVICLVGHSGATNQHHFVEAIPKTQVQLFVPSDLAARCDDQGNRIPVNRNKVEVQEAARQAGIPTTVISFTRQHWASTAKPIETNSSAKCLRASKSLHSTLRGSSLHKYFASTSKPKQ